MSDSRQLAETLYRDHHSWLRDWLRRRLGCGHSAADIAQDTFVRILSLRDAFQDIANPRGFLMTTARRLVIDRARRDILEERYLADLALADYASVQVSPEQIWQALQALEAVCRVLERVHARARRAFLMYYLDDIPQQAIADELQVSARTVRNDLALVLVRCQGMVGDELYGNP